MTKRYVIEVRQEGNPGARFIAGLIVFGIIIWLLTLGK